MPAGYSDFVTLFLVLTHGWWEVECEWELLDGGGVSLLKPVLYVFVGRTFME